MAWFIFLFDIYMLHKDERCIVIITNQSHNRQAKQEPSAAAGSSNQKGKEENGNPIGIRRRRDEKGIRKEWHRHKVHPNHMEAPPSQPQQPLPKRRLQQLSLGVG